jgi:hypothetical protein
MINIIQNRMLCPECDKDEIYGICDKYAAEQSYGDDDPECKKYDEAYDKAEKSLSIEECDNCVREEKFHLKYGL